MHISTPHGSDVQTPGRRQLGNDSGINESVRGDLNSLATDVSWQVVTSGNIFLRINANHLLPAHISVPSKLVPKVADGTASTYRGC